MRWRVIIRFSFERDAGSKLRNQIAPALEKCGIVNTNTGSWEGPAVAPLEAAEQLREIIATLATVTVEDDGVNVSLDHLWIYIDRVEG